MSLKTKEFYATWVPRAVGERVKIARGGKITQNDLARSIGVDRSSIAKIETGRQGITLDTLYAIAERLGKNPVDLLPPLSEADDPPPSVEDILKNARTLEDINTSEMKSIMKVIEQRGSK